jgi:hypothetical protein
MEALVTQYDLTYMSYGAGVQSTAMLVCSNLGLHGVPKVDVAIFADTGDEPQYVYDNIERMTAWSDIPLEVVTAGNLADSVTAKSGRYTNIPAWGLSQEGMSVPLKRSCTTDYKIKPIERHVRHLLGYKKGQRVKERVLCCMGISLDEAHRMKPSRTHWIDNAYPLVDGLIRRHKCVEIVTQAGLPMPQRSSCVYCPYHSDDEWRKMKQDRPEDFARACEVDMAIRDPESLYDKAANNPAYLHKSRQPLSEVDFTDNQLDLFGNECEGYCGL